MPSHPVCHLTALCSPSLHTFGNEELTTQSEGNLKKNLQTAQTLGKLNLRTPGRGPSSVGQSVG